MKRAGGKKKKKKEKKEDNYNFSAFLVQYLTLPVPAGWQRFYSEEYIT